MKKYLSLWLVLAGICSLFFSILAIKYEFGYIIITCFILAVFFFALSSVFLDEIKNKVLYTFLWWISFFGGYFVFPSFLQYISQIKYNLKNEIIQNNGSFKKYIKALSTEKKYLILLIILYSFLLLFIISILLWNNYSSLAILSFDTIYIFAVYLPVICISFSLYIFFKTSLIRHLIITVITIYLISSIIAPLILFHIFPVMLLTIISVIYVLRYTKPWLSLIAGILLPLAIIIIIYYLFIKLMHTLSESDSESYKARTNDGGSTWTITKD